MQIEKKEAFVSFVKAGLSNIPVVGQFLTEILFELNGRVKQERLNNFIEILKESIENNNQDFDIENIKSEDFGDLFEGVLKKSIYAKSKEKLIAFKNILLKGMRDNSQINKCEIFSELLSNLSNKHIEILNVHKEIFEKSKFPVSYSRKRDLQNELFQIQQKIINKDAIVTEDAIDYSESLDMIPSLESRGEEIKSLLEQLNKNLEDSEHFREHGFYNISQSDHLFYLQDLSSKALLVDEGIGGIGTESFEIMTITTLGIDFLNFIKES